MRGNPYTILFGKEPIQNIHRIKEENEIINSFTDEVRTQQAYMIAGVRGSGKTVFMSDVTRRIAKEPGWKIVELSSEGSVLEKFASALAAEDNLAKIFQSAAINLSFFGFGLEVKGSAPITSIEVALTKMLESIEKHGQRVLVTIDEVIRSDGMREFASAFQLFVRKGLPIYLLMTGLYENIEELQNEKNLTFLYRMPRIHMLPLNINQVYQNYMTTLGTDRETAVQMAKMTRGYPYAFQVLGYLTWQNEKKLDHTIAPLLGQYLEEYSYDIIWQRLSEKDKEVAYGIARSRTGQTAEVREILGMQPNQFNPYRKRLIKKGLVNGEKRGFVKFTLPYFEQYVQNQEEELAYD